MLIEYITLPECEARLHRFLAGGPVQPPSDKLLVFPFMALTTSRFLMFLRMLESSLILAAEVTDAVFLTPDIS